MDMEKISYHYTKENEDVDVRSFKDLKGCFAEIDQMEEWRRRHQLGLKCLTFFKLTICV